MSFSAGVFTPLINWVNEAAAAPIEIAKHDTQDVDIAAALSNCILRDGTGIPTANTPWNNKTITGLGAPIAQTDAAQSANGFIAEATLASASTTDLGSAASHLISVTGTTTITSFGSSAATSAPLYYVGFAAALTITRNAGSMITPTLFDLNVAAGDIALCKYLGSGNWKILQLIETLSTSYTATITGCATAPTTTIYLSRSQNSVFASIPGALNAASNNTTCTFTGTLPPAYRPNRAVSGVLLIWDNTTGQIGTWSISAGGTTITLAKADNSAFTGSGSKGTPSSALLTWTLS
jgi:putative transposon-encoded protein